MTEEQRTAGDMPLPGGDFRLFVQRLGYQGMIAMGAIENPLTGRRDTHPDNARMILDDLLMLEEKTSDNLTAEESAFLDQVIASFREFQRKAAAGSTEVDA